MRCLSSWLIFATSTQIFLHQTARFSHTIVEMLLCLESRVAAWGVRGLISTGDDTNLTYIDRTLSSVMTEVVHVADFMSYTYDSLIYFLHQF